MSFGYYKKTKPPPTPNSYGFKQVSSKELAEIIKRVTTPTYSAKLQTEENKQVNNYERMNEDGSRRQIPSACSRQTNSRLSKMSNYTTDSTEDKKSKPKLSEREMSRLIRRLQRPTTASSIHSYKNEDKENLRQGKIVRARFADVEHAKSIAKLRRPTTATLAKTLNTCHLCYEHENRTNTEEADVFDYEYGDDKALPAEEIDFIVGRVSSATFASKRGQSCYRLPEYIDEVKIRENLPLLSGLSRSKNVKEITERLHYNRNRNHGYHRQGQRMGYHGHTVQATPITTY